MFILEKFFLVVLFFIINITQSGAITDIGYFWQINDLHLDLNYSHPDHQPLCHGRFGDYKCDSPLELALYALNATRQLLNAEQTPDFIVWAGDNGPHSKRLTSPELSKIISIISKRFQQLFSPENIFILPVLGNHDVVPANKMGLNETDADRLSWCHQLGSDPHLWGPWIHLRTIGSSISSETRATPIELPPYANFSTGCFFSHLLPNFRLLLISLNGLIWYSNNPSAVEPGPDPLGQLKWLNDSLSWARRTGFKVLLVSHFPPGASENTPNKYKFFHPSINERFVHLLVEYADHIIAGLFAHTHVDSFRVVSDGTGHPVVSLFTSPSVCPMRLIGLGSFNPRIRLYRYNRHLGSLLGYSQYFLNLSSSGLNGVPHWSLEYDTKNAYDLNDLSPLSLNALLDQFQADNSLTGKWSLYWAHELGGRPHEYKPHLLTPDGLCPVAYSRCRCEHLCPMRFVDLDKLSACLSDCTRTLPMRQVFSTPFSAESNTSTMVDGSSATASSQASSLPIIVGVIVAFVVILIGVVLIVNRETCRNRGRHGGRLMSGATRAGSVMFTSPNGSLPSSQNGGFGLSGLPVDLDQFSDMGGSSTELRTAFHPRYIADDVNSLQTTHTSDEVSNYGINVPMCPTSINADYRRSTRSPYVTPVKTASDHPLASNRPNGVLSAAAYLQRHPVSVSTPLSANTTPKAMANLREGDHVLKRNAPSSMVCPTEDYYADDEAFGDDEDCPEMLLQYDYSPTNSEVEVPLDGGNQSFGLDQVHMPLTQTKSVKGRRFNKRIPKGSMQSVDDSLRLVHTSDVAGRRSVPVLSHSQSATLGLRSTLTNPMPNSYSAAVASSPYHNGHCSVINGHADDVILTNDSYRLEPSAVGYDYVRI